MESTASSSERGAGARSPNAARLARKRATDRKSQRNHRERHRAYVRSLEETVAGLKNASSADERVAMLSAENETLRARCQALATQLHRIRTITGENITRSDVAIQSPCPRVFCDMETLTGNIELPSGEISASLETLEPIAESSANVISANADDIVVPDTSVGTKDTNLEEYTGMARAIPALQEDPALSLVTFEPPPENFLPINPLSCFLSPPLPEYARPQGTADRLLHAMLEEAVAEHHAGRFDTSKPSLNRLLAHGPVDILSFRLFHYINQYGAMPMHWMLAIFWVQYLYLRWHVLKTDEAFALVPDFMRPTTLECAIPHRISINMIVWPDVRHGLIRDALTVDPEDVAVELLKNLPSSWTSSLVTGEMIACMDVYTMIEKQAERHESWTVGPGFLQAYPRYMNCNLGVI